MDKNNHQLTPLTIKEFLNDGKYVIPIYQRNYDWGEREALQLLEDISDYAQNNNNQQYYIGSAVVFIRAAHGNTYFETIDGQQRLTTLTILACLLKHHGAANWFNTPNLSYDHRKEADEALMMLLNQQYSEHPSAQNIVGVYRLLKRHLQSVLDDKGLGLQTFADYLFKQVIILRIPVPQDTQLNHYFEIMNTRGEQLEKHEVLKAVLMGKLAPEEYPLFHLIWEACSDMNSYVQMNFSVDMREVLFGTTWSELQVNPCDALSFDVWYNEFRQKTINLKTGHEEGAPRTLDSLFEDAKSHRRHDLPSDRSADEGKQDRFGSIINFPNFLLQVLKVCYHNSHFYKQEVDAQIRLDDKALIPTFQAVLKSMADDGEKTQFVKFFIMKLLFLRTLYDRYVIKREYVNGTELWSLKTLCKYDNGTVNYVNTFLPKNKEDDPESEDGIAKEIRLLEAMFHVSAPTQIYKHWLNAVLYYVHTTNCIEASSLRDRLYDLARCFMLDVYLANKDNKRSFEEIVYREGGKPYNSTDDIDWEPINQGCNVHNFIFNFYDFILWQESPSQYPRFDFSYRTSVEHFYPQTPMNGYDPLAPSVLNSFGNLCLISNGMNSKFSNNMPKAKFDNFGRSKEVCSGLSLKLQEMMKVVSQGDWGESEIETSNKNAKKKIKAALEILDVPYRT